MLEETHVIKVPNIELLSLKSIGSIMTLMQ
jgi:hypothetical protein